MLIKLQSGDCSGQLVSPYYLRYPGNYKQITSAVTSLKQLRWRMLPTHPNYFKLISIIIEDLVHTEERVDCQLVTAVIGADKTTAL